ncbi:MAG: tRNA uridine-5-carboxymethylaminomethyl(34) synthesis enzyme MnmG [Verrucomicrobiota bacterium]
MTFTLPKNYDVIVVGSGHAGIEAALASARLGASTLLLTQNLDTIGQMSCNPAIGGLAKGHIVREVDALGGAMGLNADATGIHFRMLNAKKGPSVRAPRAQCDKKAYQFRLKAILERQAGLDVKQAGVSEIITRNGSVAGVITDVGFAVAGQAVVVTAGTFLCGLLHVGDRSRAGGRMADASSPLSDNLRHVGFETGRFKTGTPCRINSRSIDFSKCGIQLGDTPPPRFSFLPRNALEVDASFPVDRLAAGLFHVEQVPCWITHTTPLTHKIIRRNLHRSPLYCGRIEGTGPRYCPSIEDKVVKFADKEQHQLFLEPEGRRTEEIYVNGISTSLPYDVQLEFIHSIPGLEHAEIMRPGYAVEYDYFPPTQLRSTLETKLIANLYFAGQINGTSGYEEAAGQGMIAGVNAALKVQRRPAMILTRSEAYIGVLIDDLVTLGTQEPYRMFTSRSEHRLLLRQDNADQRLTALAYKIGLVDSVRHTLLQTKLRDLNVARITAGDTRIGGESLLRLLKRPDFKTADLPSDLFQSVSRDVWELLEIDVKYEGYIRRQSEQISQAERNEQMPIPPDVDYLTIPGLRNETRQKLNALKPDSIGRASRVSGVTPSDISIISIWLKTKLLLPKS